MDPLQHFSQKLLAERTHQSLQQQPTPPNTAPPPYTPSEPNDADMDTDTDYDESDSESDDPRPSSSPIKLTINAAHSIQGSNNLVPTSPTPLADTTKFSAVLLAAVKQLNAAAETSTGAKRALKVDLTINCGITVIGDRNVVGNVGLKAKASTASAVAEPGAAGADQPMSPSAVVVGAKRKAEDDDEDGSERVDRPAAKRVAVDGN